jgi:AraC-like DNA-binding protein
MSDPLAQVVGLLKPDLSFAKFIEGAGAWRVRRSEQGRPFFCAVLEGNVCLEVHGGEPRVVSSGDFVLIPAAYDFTASSTEPEPPARLESLPIELRPNVFHVGDPAVEANARMLVGYCAFGSTDAALLVSLLPAVIHARGEGRLTTLIQLAVEESRADRAGRDVILARLMEVLFIEALRASGPDCPSGILRGLGDDRMAAAIRHIHAAPTAPWTVASLAQVAAMSRSAFFAHFRRTVGMTPMDYLLHWRMVLAKQLLGHAPVADIARRVGYGSASTFSVAFSRHVGMSPGRYAREQAAR